MKDRGQVAFEAYDQPGCKWALQGAAERARWAHVEDVVQRMVHPDSPMQGSVAESILRKIKASAPCDRCRCPRGKYTDGCACQCHDVTL